MAKLSLDARTTMSANEVTVKQEQPELQETVRPDETQTTQDAEEKPAMENDMEEHQRPASGDASDRDTVCPPFFRDMHSEEALYYFREPPLSFASAVLIV